MTTPKTLDEWLEDAVADVEDMLAKRHITHYVILHTSWPEYLLSAARTAIYLVAIWATVVAFDSPAPQVAAVVLWALLLGLSFVLEEKKKLLSRMTPRQAKAFLARHYPND